jgi:hypothetical protein
MTDMDSNLIVLHFHIKIQKDNKLGHFGVIMLEI